MRAAAIAISLRWRYVSPSNQNEPYRGNEQGENNMDKTMRVAGVLLAAAKAKPGELTLAGSGTDSAIHVAHEKLDAFAGFELIDIPYEKLPAFVAEHARDYMVTDKRLGLVKQEAEQAGNQTANRTRNSPRCRRK